MVDNGSSHRGQAAIDRMAKAWPTATLVHTPVHASWLNQCEIYFSVVQRKVVTPNDFYDLAEVQNRLAAFEDRYNFAARPFNWTLHHQRPQRPPRPPRRPRRRPAGNRRMTPDELPPRTT